MKLPPETEAALTMWRNRLRRAGINAGSTLDELESHLRERIRARMDQGLDPQAAFDDSVLAIGSPYCLKDQFSQVGTDRQFSHAHAMYAGLAVTVIIFLWWSLVFFEFPYAWVDHIQKSLFFYSLISLPFALVWTSYHASAWSTQVDPVCRGFSRWNITTFRCSLLFTGLLALCWWGAVQDWLVSLLITYVLVTITMSLAVAVGSFSIRTRQPHGCLIKEGLNFCMSGSISEQC